MVKDLLAATLIQNELIPKLQLSQMPAASSLFLCDVGQLLIIASSLEEEPVSTKSPPYWQPAKSESCFRLIQQSSIRFAEAYDKISSLDITHGHLILSICTHSQPYSGNLLLRMVIQSVSSICQQETDCPHSHGGLPNSLLPPLPLNHWGGSFHLHWIHYVFGTCMVIKPSFLGGNASW